MSGACVWVFHVTSFQQDGFQQPGTMAYDVPSWSQLMIHIICCEFDPAARKMWKATTSNPVVYNHSNSGKGKTTSGETCRFFISSKKTLGARFYHLFYWLYITCFMVVVVHRSHESPRVPCISASSPADCWWSSQRNPTPGRWTEEVECRYLSKRIWSIGV